MTKEHTPEEIKNRLSNIGEAIGGVALEYIAELEQENKVLAQNLEDTEIVNKALEKENAELKKEWQEQVQKATDEGYARTLQTIQLTKAKELLKWALHSDPEHDNLVDFDQKWEEAEQFLNEVDK